MDVVVYVMLLDASVDAGLGLGGIRAADERSESDTQDNVAHAVTAHVWTMSGAARRWHSTGLLDSRSFSAISLNQPINK